MFRLLTFLGTSSGTPTPYRNVSSTCVSLADGRVWMVDCGEGTQHQLLRCKEVSVSKVDKVFLTHLHGDHCYGLPGMLCSMSLLWSAPGIVPDATYALKKKGAGATAAAADDDDEGAAEGGAEEKFVFDHFSKSSEFLEIYGPFGTATFLREVLRSSETRFGFRYRVTEMMYGEEEGAAEDKDKSASSSDARSGCRHQVVTALSEASAHSAYPYIECEAPTRRLHVPRSIIVDAKQHQKAESKLSQKPITVMDGYSFHIPAEVLDPVGGISMRCAWIDHPVPSLGYVFVEPTVAGALDMAKCTALGVPKGPLLAKLKKGETISFDPNDGANAKKKAKQTDDSGDAPPPALVTVSPSDVIGPAIKGRKLTILGDTCNSARLADKCIHATEEAKATDNGEDSSSSLLLTGIATDSDWLTHEATFDDNSSALALPRGHSTARMAGAFAKAVGAKKLIITHFSARYPPEEKDPQPIAMLRRQAVEGLTDGQTDPANSLLSNGGDAPSSLPPLPRDADVMAAQDFLTIDLSRAAGGQLKRFQL